MSVEVQPDCARDAFVVTPSDTQNLPRMARSLWVGTGGNVSLVTEAGNSVTFSNVPGGSYLSQHALRVNATGTTASGIVALTY